MGLKMGAKKNIIIIIVTNNKENLIIKGVHIRGAI